MRRKLRINLSVILLTLLLFSGCATYNPATGRNELILIDTHQEISIGKTLNQQILGKSKLSHDQVLQSRLQNIGKRLTIVSDRKDLIYHFGVIEDKSLNAFALPGGFIYVNSGLMNIATDDEVASVVAHELSHVAAKHSVKQLQAALGYQVVLSIALNRLGNNPGAGNIADASNVIYNLITLGYSREDERQADRLGLKYAYKAKFDPNAMVTMFQKLEKAENNRYNVKIFSSHPATAERIDNVKKEIQKLKTNASNIPEKQT